VKESKERKKEKPQFAQALMRETGIVQKKKYKTSNPATTYFLK
jgi:hypothetical protein